MNAFRNLVKQLTAIWQQAGAAQRAALAAAGVLLAAAIVGVGIWSARPQYVTLQSGLRPDEAAALATRLESQGIKYRLSLLGSAVEVAKSNLGKARMAAADLIEPSSVAGTPLGTNMMADPSLNGYNIERRLEKSLAETIQKFTAVANATVHIGRPPNSPFIKERGDVTASVVLELRPNASFSTRQAGAIVVTVARAVQGLLPENVTVTDTHGRPLSADTASADIAGQLEFRQRVETDLASNAEMMLNQLLGFGHAAVRVTADIDFTRSRRVSTIIDPDSKVRLSESIDTKEIKNSPLVAGGAAGAGTNLPTETIGGHSNLRDSSESNETITSHYIFGSSNDTIDEAAGTIKRLTVAAVVDLSPLEDKEGAPKLTQEQLTGIIKQAVGFDAARNDEIELVLAPLATAPSDEAPTPVAPWSDYEVLVRNASLGIGGMAALVLGFLILKKVQPPTVSSKGSTLDPRRARALASMSETVRRNPEQLKDALRAWLTEEESPAEESEERSEVAKAA